jgi:Domain of unknown function (DUF4351)
MALSQAFLDWEQNIVLRLLNRKFGDLSEGIQGQVLALGSVRLGILTEAALEFSSLDDLSSWLEVNH